MAEVKILIEGYATKERASPSTVLIKDGRLKILVDPGANKEMLLNALSKEGLKPEEIDLIFLTHYHPDHFLNIRLFPDKDILDGKTIYRDDEEIRFSDNLPNTNVKIIETPGHTDEHASLLVETEKGKVVIAGDLWWWYDKEEQRTDYESLINQRDPFVKDKEKLKESRKKILEIADYIIPGHGKMFKVSKERKSFI
jgi:glyoxylase-like metal-dependent hydrolase (beta-lactamase superfamily II)